MGHKVHMQSCTRSLPSTGLRCMSEKPQAIAGVMSRGDYNFAPRRSRLYKPSLIQDTELPPALVNTTSFNFFLAHYQLFSMFMMSLRTARTAMYSLRNSSTVSKQRLSQVQRHFSVSASAKQEIQEAYILSAARTPTAKV